MTRAEAEDLLFGILGPFEVRRGGRALDLGGPKQRAVLAALVLDPRRVVTVDRLIAGLWEGDPPPSATPTLHAYVSNLRRILEPDRSRRAPATVLVTRARGYALEVPDEAIDARRFEGLLSQARSLLADGRAAEAVATLDRALGLWRGEALADFVDDPFAPAEAARLEELRALAREERLEGKLALGEHEPAVAELELLVAADPLRERLWRLLMLALYRSGRQADALRAFQQARRTLAEELGIDPSPALQKLEVDILNQSPAIDPPAAPAPIASGMASRAAPRAGAASRPSPPGAGLLVGRDRELERLDATVEAALDGRGRVVLISGEAGIGKTRLAEELEARAAAGGMDVVWGRCLEGGAAPPFWPWMQALRALDDARPEGVAEGRLSDLLPQAEAGEEERLVSRARIHDAISRALLARARARPLTLVLDDLQWADVPSLELLRFVAAMGRSTPILIAGTYRDTDVGEGHPLHDLIGALAHDANVDRVAVAGLGAEEVAAFIAGATGGRPPPQLVAAVHRRTDGNPFFVSEVVRLLEGEGGLEQATADLVASSAVPLNVRDAILRRLAGLPRSAVEVLSLAAVAGREFDLRVLVQGGDRPGEETLDALDAAVTRGVAAPADASLGRYRFVHDLVRDALRERLSPVRRARLHAALARTLASLGADDPASIAEVAHHAWEGASALGAEHALPHVLLAAGRAAAQLAYERAEEQYARALSLLQSLPASEDVERTRLDVAERLSRLRWMVRGYGALETGEALDRARALALKGEGRRELLSSLWGLCAYHVIRAELDAGDDLAGQLVAMGNATGEAAFLGAGHHGAGVVALCRGDLERAKAHLVEAIAVLNDPASAELDPAMHHEVAGLARSFLAVALAYEGRAQAARRLVEEVNEMDTAWGDAFDAARGLVFDGWVSVILGDPERARARAEAAIAIADRNAFRLWSSVAPIQVGWARAVTGDPETGERLIAEGIRRSADQGRFLLEPLFLGLLAEAQILAGASEEAARTLDRAFEIAERTGEHLHDERLRRLADRISETAGAGA